jgi:IS30 family transposase
MTNQEKRELRQLCKQGYSFKEIRGMVDCCDSTIKSYMKIFSKGKKNERGQ